VPVCGACVTMLAGAGSESHRPASRLAIGLDGPKVRKRKRYRMGAMRLVQIRARTDEDADCLRRELASYSPTRKRRSILVELEERSETDVLAFLSAVETCLNANDIPSVRVELDGRTYMLDPQR
jgi:hypothetical protein